MSNDWTTQIGDVLTRDQLKALYGGAPYGGIEPSAQTPNVLVFMDPAQAKANGYVFDGWADDGSLLYTGEGRLGDQLLKDGNKSLASHIEQGRSLRLFKVVGKVPNSGQKRHEYLGEFRIDANEPFTQQEARDRSGALRTVLVFKLWPIEAGTPRDDHKSATGTPPKTTQTQLIDLESDVTWGFVTSGTDPTTAQKREAALVGKFKESMGEQGAGFKRFKIRPAGELSDQRTDVYDPATKTLYEAKGTATRESVRMAVGQLLDYRRHVPADVHAIAVLLPHRPAEDLCHFLASLEIRLTYQEANGSFTTV